MNRKAKILTFAVALVVCVFLAFGVAWTKKYEGRTPWIGVYTQSIDDDLADAFNLERTEGTVIVDVVDDSPAEEAGLRRKDIILEFNGKKVEPGRRLIDYVRETKVGDEVEVVILRKGEEKTLTVEIGERPESSWRYSDQWFDAEDFYKHALGFTSMDRGYIGISVQDLNEQLGDYFGVENGNGVLITEVLEDTPAEEVGLKAGDVIITADGERVYDAADLHDIISDFKEGDEVVIEYLRRGEKQTATVEVIEESFASRFQYLPNISIGIPNVPRLHGLDHFYLDKDDFPEIGDYEEDMKKLKDELNELRKELKELESKMD